MTSGAERVKRVGQPPGGWRALPLLLALTVATGSVILWQHLGTRDQEQIQRTIALEAATVKNEIVARMEARLLTLVRMARRFEVRQPSREEWESDAQLLVQHYPGTQAVIWIDSAYRAQWVVPTQGNEVLEGAHLGLAERRRQALDEARAAGELRLLRTFDLLEGHKGVLVVAPIRGGGGWIGHVFRTQKTLDQILTNVARDYGISVWDEHDEIYYRRRALRILDAPWKAREDVQLAGTMWVVRAWPQPALLAGMHSSLGTVALVGGTCLALLLGLSVFLGQTATWKAAQVEAANRELEREVIERKRAQEAASYLAAIVDSSDDAIVGQTLDGRVVSWNAGAERLYGYEAEEMQGQPLTRLLAAGQVDDVRRVLSDLTRGEAVDHYETSRVRRDGREVQVSITASPIRNSSGDLLGVATIARDVTRRRRAEAEVQRTLERMDRSAKDQTMSLAATSHDVRGALTAIAGYASMLGDMVQQADLRQMALRIMSLAYTLSDVMGDLLQFAREQRPAKLRRQSVSARELVSRCARDFSSLAGEKGLNLRVEPPEEGDIVTDPAEVTRILQNLISNAVRYTAEGEIVVCGELTPSELRVTVRDTGIGIPEEDLERVFEEFYRSEQARTMETLGTGLGLSTVKRLAHLLGGEVRVESRVGEGSTFEVILPRNGVS